jgi:hypothetical protein
MEFFILLLSMLGVVLIYYKNRFNSPFVKYVSISLLLFQILSLLENGLIYFKIKSDEYSIFSKEFLLFFLTMIVFYSINDYGNKK